MFDAMAGVGAGIGVFGALSAAQSESESLDSQAQLQMKNATLAIEKGKQDATRQSLYSNRQIGSEIASYGASGVSSDSGSVQAVIQASTTNAEMDRLNILHGADVRALNYRNQASLDEFGSSQALSGGYFAAAAKVFGGVSRVYARQQAGKAGGTQDSGGGYNEPGDE